MCEVENKTPLISLIMPVYNAEKYLSASVDSVLSQTFQDFELILVVDCSPDNSASIADKYAEDFTGKIRVIHLEKNGGASNARNVGIENARGKYVGFIDSDDTVENVLLETAVKYLSEYSVDAFIFGATEYYYAQNGELKYTEKVVMSEDKLLPDKESLRKEIIHLEERTLYGYAWNKIYKLSRITENGIHFENMRLHEDTLFNIAYFMDAKSAYISSASMYNYAKRIENSITSQFVPEYYELHTRKIQKLYDQHVYWNMCTPDVKRILANIYTRYTLSALQRNCDKRAGMNHRDRKRFFKEQYGSVLYKELMKYCGPDNKLLAIFAMLYKRRCTGLSLMLARTVFVIKNKLPIVFAKLKR